jgi:hypothetical protein
MVDNAMTNRERARRRWTSILFLIGLTAIFTLSFTFTATAQTGGGLGVGRGQGMEVGINLPVFNQIKADAARGIYDRPCTAAEHNTMQWHTLVNVQAKCHYDHMHGDDPNYVTDIFGEPGAWFTKPGQSISYPWQTFKATSATEPNDAFVAAKQMENDLKHEGYIWVVRRDQACPNGACVTDFRLQTHAIFAAHDMPVRFHSFSLEARLCNVANDPSSCGIVRYGGWIDTGLLFTTRPNVLRCDEGVEALYIPLAVDTQFFPIQENPGERGTVRCHPNIVNLPAYPSARPLAEWWEHGGGETRYQLRVYDPIGNVDPADPSRWQFFCGQNDLNCRYDASIFSAFIGYTLHIHEFVGKEVRVDSDRNGRTDFRGYFSRFGELRTACTAAGLDCVPYVYDNVPLNYYFNKDARYAQTVCENCQRVDMDLSPPGQKWITWFYRYAAGGHTPTPPPTTPSATPITPTATPVTPTATSMPPTSTPVTDPTTPSVRVDLNKTSAAPGESLEVSLKLFNVTNLYGLQATCAVDPTVLTGTTVMNGEAFINETNSFFVDNHFQTDGSWLVAATLKQPATPIAGTMVAYKLGYTVQGTAGSAVNCSVLAVDEDGHEIALEVINGSYNGGGTTVTNMPPTSTPVTPTATPVTLTATPVTPTATPITPVVTEEPPPATPLPAVSVVSGTFQYQNHPDHAGITVQLLSAGNSPVSLTTNANGAYQFTDVPAGEYVIEASAPNHLTVSKAVTVPSTGQAVDLGVLVLPAGDTDEDGTIGLSDASLVGVNFGLSAPPAPPAADVNVDNQVNIRDLALVGGNYGKTGPVTAP